MAGNSRGPVLAEYLEGLFAMLEDFVAESTLSQNKKGVGTLPLHF